MKRYAHNGIVYKDFDHPRYKYKLLKQYTFILTNAIPSGTNYQTSYMSVRGHFLTLQPGYAWDGPSGPTIDTKNFMRGSLIHDALYQLMREGVLDQDRRRWADLALFSICRADGMSYFRAYYVWLSVRWFGAKNAQRSEPEN